MFLLLYNSQVSVVQMPLSRCPGVSCERPAPRVINWDPSSVLLQNIPPQSVFAFSTLENPQSRSFLSSHEGGCAFQTPVPTQLRASGSSARQAASGTIHTSDGLPSASLGPAHFSNIGFSPLSCDSLFLSVMFSSRSCKSLPQIACDDHCSLPVCIR